MMALELRRFSIVVVDRSSSMTASAGTPRSSTRYMRMASASDTASSAPWPPDAMMTARRWSASHSSTALSRRAASRGVGFVPDRPAPCTTM